MDFNGGEYNDAADVTSFASEMPHSWVEVYFPETESLGRHLTRHLSPARRRIVDRRIAGTVFSKYLEALETFWIQYFVAFDNQEQRSLFAKTVRRGVVDYQSSDLVGYGTAFRPACRMVGPGSRR